MDYKFTEKLPENRLLWDKCLISSDGVYAIALGENQLYISNNSGDTWVRPADTLIFNFIDYIAIDKSGQYMFAASIGITEENGKLYLSVNYGVNWTEITTWPGYEDGKIIEGIGINSNGTEIFICYHTDVDYPNGETFYYSSVNLGVDWVELTVPSVISEGNAQAWFFANEDSTIIHIYYEYGVFRSDNHGTDWTAIYVASSMGKEGMFSVSEDGVTMLINDYNILYLSVNSGADWVELPDLLL